jgi:hypothetical protein
MIRGRRMTREGDCLRRSERRPADDGGEKSSGGRNWDMEGDGGNKARLFFCSRSKAKRSKAVFSSVRPSWFPRRNNSFSPNPTTTPPPPQERQRRTTKKKKRITGGRDGGEVGSELRPASAYHSVGRSRGGGESGVGGFGPGGRRRRRNTLGMRGGWKDGKGQGPAASPSCGCCCCCYFSPFLFISWGREGEEAAACRSQESPCFWRAGGRVCPWSIRRVNARVGAPWEGYLWKAGKLFCFGH